MAVNADRETIRALSDWGKESAANLAELKADRDNALKMVRQGKGKLISGGGNGTNFAVSDRSKTWEELAGLLGIAYKLASQDFAGNTHSKVEFI